MQVRIKTSEEFWAAHVTIEIKADDQEQATQVIERLHTAAEVADLQTSEAKALGRRLKARVNELEAEVLKLSKGHVCTDRCEPNAHVAFTGRKRIAELEEELAAERDQGDQDAREIRTLRRKMEDIENEVSNQSLRADKAEIALADCRRVREDYQTRAVRLAEQLVDQTARADRLDQELDRARHAASLWAERAEARLARLHTTQVEMLKERKRADQNREWAERAEARVAKLDEQCRDIKAVADAQSERLAEISNTVDGAEVLRTAGSNPVAVLNTLVQQIRSVLDVPPMPEAKPAE